MKKICILLFITVLFSCTQKYPFRIGKDYVFDYDGASYFCLLNNKRRIIILGDIKKLNFDSIYIVAKQKPVDEFWEKTRDIPGMTSRKRKAIFKNSTLYYYWIVNKKKDYIYGPLSKERYKALKDSLHIGLKLKKPSEL